ncbi:phosphoadenylyl-sulfate reductase [Candidatus Hakubella thermalkaliphila]|uniref:Phosphoadenosine phosphosulfate reductase n=1 Tax=Candidatus Hakubella thermalkaliphila TaxID=2754717 RepID=A0A6V8QA15_9ACTN|nr:phosphoadenylyl-sulfate reductase [Candidatus Hakubella thermalkaliphila]GFP39721.1 phosphoadenosine phosphosulfate reductase [Candidatus Hakubella thermalkaliphila]
MGQFEEFADLEAKTAKEVLEWALKTYGDRVALASSFGAEDVVLIDMLARVDRRSRVFTLDTGRLPQETCDVMEKIRDKYGLKIEIYYPDTEAVEDMVAKYGPNLFYKNVELRKLCCEIRKVEPLKRALKELSAWITGLRREQSVTRTEVKKSSIHKSINQSLKHA